MFMQKNSLNLKNNNTINTYSKSIYSNKKVDGIILKKNRIIVSDSREKKEQTVDDNKRLFLKVAGVASLGLAASALFPKSADAYVSGSTPTSNVVGLKNIANTKIDPATESKQDAILAELQQKANLTETQPVSIASTVNVGISGSANTIGINNEIGARINPAQDDSIILLRRMVKLMESQAVVDNQMRQRVVVDSGGITVSGSVTVATITSLNQLAGVDSRWQIIDWSRQAYNSGIRGNLLNS